MQLASGPAPYGDYKRKRWGTRKMMTSASDITLFVLLIPVASLCLFIVVCMVAKNH